MSAKTLSSDRVTVSVPRGGDREDPNLFVAVNGVNYLLPRGRRSEVSEVCAVGIPLCTYLAFLCSL